MLQWPEVLSPLNPEEIVEGFETAEFKKLGRLILEKSTAGRAAKGADLIAEIDDPQTRNLMSSLLLEEIQQDRDSCRKIVKQYRAHLRKRQIKSLSKKIKEAERRNDQELLNQLLAEKQQWAEQQVEAPS
jgi:hypothetical protein